MTIGMGEGKTSRDVDRCFVWEVLALGPSLAILDRYPDRVKGNGDQTSKCARSHLEVMADPVVS